MSLSFSSQPKPQAAIGDPQTGTVVVWDLIANKKIQTLQVAEPNELVTSEDVISSLTLSPDGERLITMHKDATIETRNVNTGQKLISFAGPRVLDSARLSFSPEGKWLVVADCTGIVAMPLQARKYGVFPTEQAGISSIAFSADGKQIAVSSPLRETKIWDFETGQELLKLPGASSIQFTPDGTRLIIGRQPGEGVGIHLMRLEDLVAIAKSHLTRSLTLDGCRQYLHMEYCQLES